MATKKRTGEEKTGASKSGAAARKPRAKTGAGPARAGSGGGAGPRAARRGKAAAPAEACAPPRLRASHASVDTSAPRARKKVDGPLAKRRSPIVSPAEKASRPPASKRTPLGAPKRPAGKREVTPEASSAARELAVSIAIAGLDKKAVAIEILDVTGKVDYADFLVVMTGRSDRHVHSIATGIEEALVRKNKVKPLSVEGLATASWVLIDFGEVVVHVFQEDSRRLYDIEGLWIDAGRVPLPEGEQKVAAQIDQAGEPGFGPLA